MTNLEIRAALFETKEQNNNRYNNETVLHIDTRKENSLLQLIINARQQGFNCLDLSKRNIKEFPSQLLDFPSLQYLYLEGNQLGQLPPDLFIRLSNLKWLDLRNNHLTSIPNHGLAKHSSLQYLLLSGNRLRKLPCELGRVKSLSALNLDGNPLDHPPIEIIKQGIKAIQQYLRDTLQSDDDDDDDSLLSDDNHQQQTPRFPPRKSKLESDYGETTLPDLPPLRVQSCKQYERTSYSARRSVSPPHSAIKSAQVVPKTITRNVYTAPKQPLVHPKHREVKPDQEKQRYRPRSLIKTNDDKKPIVQTPYLINCRYTRMISKEQLDFIKSLSSEYIGKEDDVRRTYDRQIHDHVRQITDKMLKRRLEARGSIFEERRQVKLEIHELRRLVSEGKQHRPPQVATRSKTFSDKTQSSKKL